MSKKTASDKIEKTASSVSTTSCRRIIRAALFTPIARGRWGLPLCLWGEPGVAKSAIIEMIAEECGLPCETLSPGERGEGAFGVIPVPQTIGGKSIITYPAPDWTARMEQGGVVFVDELTTAPPAIQPALLGLVLARRIGGTILGDRVRVIAAANPPELAAGGYDLPPPEANRFGHIQWAAPTVEEHTAFMLGGGQGNGGHADAVIDATVEERRVLAAWGEPWAIARGLETAYLRAQPHHKNMCPPAGDPKGSRGWPSDRSWEAATRALASAKVHDLSQIETDVFVASFIGEQVASEFFEFMSKQDLPNPAELLDGKITFVHTAARLDRTAAVLQACTALVTPANAPRRKERAEAFWGMLESLAAGKADLDILVPTIEALIKAGLHAMKSASKTLASVSQLLSRANIKPGAR